MSNTVKLNNCPKCGVPIPADAPQGLCPKCVLLGAATSAESGHAPTATSEIPTIDRLAAAFPQLEIIELIGRGGMGFVFKARQPHLDRFVALKLLPDKLARDPRFAERFGREGRVLAKLNHPNIVSVYDFGSTEHFYFLLMEYVDGVNLRQAMQAGRFSPGEALAIVPKICEALQYAHEQGILHRDIKPENILLDARGQVKIADFGIAKLVGEDKPDVTLTATGAALGTPHYMAPEQLEQPTEVDHRADIYSLGVVFYEMLTGELPIGRFAAPSSKTPVGVNVDEVVFRTLEKDRELRFQSAGEMKTEVEHLGGGEPGAGSEAAGPGSPVVPDASMVKRPAQALLAVGIFNWVGSLIVMLMLGYAGLGREFPVSPQELGFIGLLMIVFSSVILLAALTMMKRQAYPLAVLGGVLAMITTPGNILGLPVGLWVLVTLRQPGVRAAFNQQGGAASRGARGLSLGVSVAIVAGILVCGIGLVLPRLSDRKPVEPLSVSAAGDSMTDTNQPTIDAAPMIQFTFTNVELREESGARWLAMDFVEQRKGDCERTFRYDASVPGFKVQSRTTAFMTEAKAGFAPVLHQSVSWKLPGNLPPTETQALRDLVAKEWIGKSAIIEPGDERLLFKVVVPGGGSLVTAIGVAPRKPVSGIPREVAIGVAKLIAARDYQNFALARIESVPGHPLHQMVARFAGPEIPQLSRSAVTGPLLVPSPDEDMNTTAEPVDGSILWGTYRAVAASAVSFECPGDYSLQFMLPDENLARDAARQINQALAQPISLVPGRQTRLFTTGNWKGWLETRPFKPEPNRLAFFRHPGRSPAQIPGTNAIESAVATIPPGHDLKLTGRIVVNGVEQSETAFSATLSSGPNEPGIYWFTWYLLPNPRRMDLEPKANWELQIQDAVGRELLRSKAPVGLKILWQKKWVGDEPISVRTGKPVREVFFEKANMAGDRGPTMLLLEMTTQRSVPVSPDQ